MTKTSFSRGTQDLQDRELRDDELDAVTGGLVVNAIIAVLIGLFDSGYASPNTATAGEQMMRRGTFPAITACG